MKFYLKNGKLYLARFIVEVVETNSRDNTSTITTRLFGNESDALDYYKAHYNSSDPDHATLTKVSDKELEPYLQYEGLATTQEEARLILGENVDAILNYRINIMNEACTKAITDGLDIQISNGDTKHFSLTEKDQINLLGLTMQVATGIFNSTGVPYHADGEECKIYSLQDFNLISTKCFAWKTYHTTYCNLVKAYLRKLASDKNIIEIHKLQYGDQLPDEYMNQLNDLLKIIQVGAVL